MPARGPVALCCPCCSSSNVADLGGYAECRECGYGFGIDDQAVVDRTPGYIAELERADQLAAA